MPTSKKLTALALATGMLAAAEVGVGAEPASAWCYNIGSHTSASLDWEWNGSDINITWGAANMAPIARRDFNYSRPTLRKDWVRNVGGRTKQTAGTRARVLASWRHTAFLPYGDTHSVWDGYARRLSNDEQACT